MQHKAFRAGFFRLHPCVRLVQQTNAFRSVLVSYINLNTAVYIFESEGVVFAPRQVIGTIRYR